MGIGGKSLLYLGLLVGYVAGWLGQGMGPIMGPLQFFRALPLPACFITEPRLKEA